MAKVGMTYDHVLVTDEDNSTKSAGGLHIPERYQGEVKYGTVAAAGPGSYSATGELIAPQVKTGDRIAYFRTKGIPTVIDGVKYLVMKDIDALYILS